MTRFIHTADLQIGKPYLQITDEEKRFKLKQERLNVINRIRDHSKKNASEFVLIAGDLFDSPTPSISAVTEVLEALGKMDVPVIVIPGNHDHGALGTIWHNNSFKKYQNQMAPNLMILLDCQPVELKEAIILPCPLLRNKNNIDPTEWLKHLDWRQLSSTKPRIILAHGAVLDFRGHDYTLDNEEQLTNNSAINLKDLPDQEIDYIALGDWHNLKQITKKAWYPGTPEPDRFDQGDNNQRGQVLQVDVSRSQIPQVKSIPTGHIQWHNITFRFTCDDDISRLERQVEELTEGRISRDLLRIEVSGSLSLAGHRQYKLLQTDLQNKLLRLRIKGDCQKMPENGELEQLTSSFENPLIAEVASQLQKLLKEEEAQCSQQASITRLALCELHRIAITK